MWWLRKIAAIFGSKKEIKKKEKGRER